MNTGPHTISIAGSALRFQVAAGDNLLRGGLRAGVGLAHECNAGGCGSCKFDLVSGSVRDLWIEAPGLSGRDRARGRRLACQCEPTSDCEIKIRHADEFVAPYRPLRFDAIFVGSRAVTVDIRAFTFRADAPARFAPGQYALLMLPGDLPARAYSMSNQPNEQGDWEFMVRRVEGGRVSARLFAALHEGERVQVDGPLGLAHWREDSERDIVCIAGGSGIAPMISIMNAATGRRTARLFYGGRSPADIPDFADWLHETARDRVNAAVSTSDGEGGASWVGERGLIPDVALRAIGADGDRSDFYLAGPPSMIEALVRRLIVEHAVPAARTHYDRFF